MESKYVEGRKRVSRRAVMEVKLQRAFQTALRPRLLKITRGLEKTRCLSTFYTIVYVRMMRSSGQ